MLRTDLTTPLNIFCNIVYKLVVEQKPCVARLKNIDHIVVMNKKRFFEMCWGLVTSD